MDPRHPELAVSRMRELMKQYEAIENDMRLETISSKLSSLEREASLVIQEICLVAPRLHEAMMQVSRNRRHDLARGNDYTQMREYAATAEIVEEPEVIGDSSTVIAVDEYITEEAEVVKKEAKPKAKKKSTKQKAKK